MWYEWKPYIPVAQRRLNARRELAKLGPKGGPRSPVVIDGRTIARTFWGRSWCENLERYSDYANRLPRGRTYARNGSVVDLQVRPGEVAALVAGSRLYRVAVKVAPVPSARWRALCGDCTGQIDSLVELLQGRFSQGVMERLCRPRQGLFPAPEELTFTCSCPDWAAMCKHVAAVFYGLGARLDERPELLFTLRQVDQGELIARAGQGLELAPGGPGSERILGDEGLSELFGLELEGPAERSSEVAVKRRKEEEKQKKTKKKRGKGPAKRRTKAPAVVAPRRRGRSPKRS
jgi:uncharacterized Zn finger protein